ncbi:hypothetical protein EVJ32_00565 [Exiguobacterium sp. SH5S4]|uniref:DUF6678 family protein n=1 Tax=Exiguobacterium sp. SH5S4 TaxID=2510961 RepID=UPI00103E3805|nr:DUF6678 family protein [Exiguobacterium sp. SH5S4]TCI27730.1 hypothetical protein EVJ32_00565 [Exiguobacterium sp. SH5S4]
MDRQKELQEIEERQLTSVMNETRWKRLGQTVSATLPYLPPYQIKYLGEDTLFPSEELSQFINLDWDDIWVESSLRSIEWIRLRSKMLLYKGVIVDPDVCDMTDELIDILKKERIPFIQKGDIIQVFGYVRETGIFQREEK